MDITAISFEVPKYEPKAGRMAVIIENKLPATILLLLKDRKPVGILHLGSETFPDIDVDAIMMSSTAYENMMKSITPEQKSRLMKENPTGTLH